MSTTADPLREEVRRRYAEAALAASEGCGCGCGEADETDFGARLYGDAGRDELPDAARLASLGCATQSSSRA